MLAAVRTEGTGAFGRPHARDVGGIAQAGWGAETGGTHAGDVSARRASVLIVGMWQIELGYVTLLTWFQVHVR